jgi:hypothetical protein
VITDTNLRQALRSLGATLADRGLRYHVAVVGGSALLLREIIQRPTQDVDVVAVAAGIDPPTPRFELPEDLRDAAADVALSMGLGDGTWINSGAVALIGDKLPRGYLERSQPIVFDGLTVSVLSRLDLLRLKVYAATDEGPGSHHTQDLIAMRPSQSELREAIGWVRDNTGQDPIFVDEIARAFGVEA